MSAELVDLSPNAGLALLLDHGTGRLLFAVDTVAKEPDVRRLGDLVDVFDRLTGAADLEQPVSYLYRAVRDLAGEPLLEAAGLRYDVTITLPGTVEGEFLKTTGHYHPPDSTGVSFPEVYEVIHGRAAFVLQHVDDVTADRPRVDGLWVQVCEASERIVIPPDCGHVTVNIGSEPLAVADLVSLRCGHLYGSFKALAGAACVLVEDPGDPSGFRVVANAAYGELPEPVVAHGSRSHPFLTEHGPLYSQFTAEPQAFAFLDRPAESASSLPDLWYSGSAEQRPTAER